MTPQEELAKLRRMKELEAKSGGDPNHSDFANMVAGKRKPTLRERISAANPAAGALIDYEDAAQHHLMNLPLGLEQTLGHTLDYASNLLPEKYANNSHRMTAELDHALAQREQAYQKRTKDGLPATLGATAGEILPWTVGAGEKALAWIGGKLAPEGAGLFARIGSGATQGGAIASAQPVTGDGNYGEQKALQVASGTLAGGAIPPIAAVTRKVSGAVGGLLAPILAPQRVANKQLARLYGSDAEVLQKLHGADSYFPGETVTAAQALQTPEAVMAEKALRNRPDIAAQFTHADNANNAGRLDVVRNHAGTDEQLNSAVKVRKDESAPFYAALDSADKVNPTPVLNLLRNLALSGNATVRSAAKAHLALLNEHANGGVMVPASALDDIRQNIGSMLAQHAPNGAVGSQEAAKYGPVASQIIRTLDRAVPGYRDYLSTYRANSAPINSMEASRRILEPVDQRGLNSAGDSRLTLSALNTGLNKADRARYGLTPDARAAMDGLRQSLQRESVSNSITKGGSDTAYNLQADGWLGRQLYGSTLAGPTPQARGVTGLLGGYLGHTVGIPGAEAAGFYAGLHVSKLAEMVNSRIAQRVGKGAADSREAAKMIEAFLSEHPADAPALLQRYPQWAALVAPARGLLDARHNEAAANVR